MTKLYTATVSADEKSFRLSRASKDALIDSVLVRLRKKLNGILSMQLESGDQVGVCYALKLKSAEITKGRKRVKVWLEEDDPALAP